MKRLIGSIAIMAALSAAPAGAADSTGGFHIIGEPGTLACATITQKVAANDEQFGLLMSTWIAGYVTALNRTTPDTYNVIGNVEIPAFFDSIVRHCRAKPSDLLEAALYQVVYDLYDRRQTKAP